MTRAYFSLGLEYPVYASANKGHSKQFINFKGFQNTEPEAYV